MTREELLARFPDMTEVSGAPSMFLLNGCGTTIYGKRDWDEETRTYVKTYCFVLVFVPVFALFAYRVADAGGGSWYFIGRVPLSGLAKLWNLCLIGLLAGIVSLGYLSYYTSTPEYKAEQELAAADEVRAAGSLKQAVDGYISVMNSGTPSVAPAGQHLTAMLQDDLPKASLQTITGVVRIVAENVHAKNLDPGLYDRMMAVVKDRQNKEPVNALELCNLLKPLAKDAKAHEALRMQLLDKALAADPQNVELVCQVASACEERGDMERCVKLLEPVRAKLGLTEGARILGQIYARQDRCEDSYQLLMPYAEGRLKRLHEAEKRYETTIKGTADAAFNQLRNGQGPASFYREYEKLDKAAQQQKVDDFIAGKIKGNKQIDFAMENLQREARIVPVALDLGIVRLRRAQEMTDPAARKKELEGAEKVFLDIQGVAGEKDEFRLFSGQVKYWLGKHDEGKALFDQFLATNNRSAKSLLIVCRMMREVGENELARKMAEEAYGKAKDTGEEKMLKSEAAQVCAILSHDLDDEILWLGRADANESAIKASLASARGKKALQEDRKDEAAREFRTAMQIHLSQHKDHVTLNNAAIASQHLFAATGNTADFTKGIELMEEASQLAPKNSILLSNLCGHLEEGICVQMMADALDWKALDLHPSRAELDLLYRDEAGWESWRAKWIAHPYASRIWSNREKLMVLAPKLAANYASLATEYAFVKNVEALRAVCHRALSQSFNVSEDLAVVRDYYAGKRDEQNRKTLLQARDKYAKIIASRTDSKADRVRGVACCLWAGVQFEVLDLNVPVDLDELVRRIEQAEAEAPCSRSRRLLQTALLERAAFQVGQTQKPLSEMLRRGRRTCSTGDIVGLAMEKDPAVRDALSQHPDFKRAMELRKVHRTAFPKSCAEWEWAVLHASAPAEAEALARIIREDECKRLANEIQLHVYPFSPSVTMDRYWFLQAEGKADKAHALLVDLGKQGIPLPLDP